MSRRDVQRIPYPNTEFVLPLSSGSYEVRVVPVNHLSEGMAGNGTVFTVNGKSINSCLLTLDKQISTCSGVGGL